MIRPTLLALTYAFLPSLVAAQELTEEQLIQLATDRGTCSELVPVAAVYDPPGGNTVKVTCSEATGFLPAVGAAGGLGAGAAAAAGLALVAVAGGGGGAPSTTN